RPASASFTASAGCLNECKMNSRTCSFTCCFVTGCLETCFTNCNTVLNRCTNLCGTLNGDADPIAVVSGAHISVGVPLTCPADLEVQDLEVRVTQRVTGAVAEGHVQGGVCTGDAQHFDVDAVTHDSEAFLVPAEAEVCLLVRLGDRGRSLESHQWCRDVE